MPPKAKITKDIILDAAISIVREKGENAVNSRSIASVLNCSTQPLFSHFDSMEELKKAVSLKAAMIFTDYILNFTKNNKYPKYKASGIGYIMFAKEEPELFKMLFYKNNGAHILEQNKSFENEILGLVKNSTGLSDEVSKRFHLNMWLFVHGIASTVSSSYIKLDNDIIDKTVTEAFKAFSMLYGGKNK